MNFKKIEPKWQKKYEEEKVFVVKKNKKPKYYSLTMFPYPSGEGLHTGHALVYTVHDIRSRFKIMQGFNVLNPMGYDSLGLPAENAAIKVGTHPEKYTNNSIKNFIKQQKALGLSYDWSRMINTASPEFYKWDQWIFLKMFEKGIAYKKRAPVNWCSKCETVLANEQVVNGTCWRHEDTEVEVKHLEQWFFKITDYAEELLDKLDELDWPQRTKTMQKNWIGKSYGTEINFEVNNKKFPIFTTRPDTIYGVTFMVISAQHSKLNELVTKEQEKEVKKFLKKIKSVSEKDQTDLEKEGVFTGSYAINPINNEKVPIYAGNFVVADYGSGMVMAVPAHDKRDFAFAKKYNIPIKVVVHPKDYEEQKDKITEAYTGEGVLINSEKFNGILNVDAKEKITKHLQKNKLAKKAIQYKLKDWLISRQRYWGTPIPIVYCEKCGIVPVPEKDLPIKLPKKVKFGKGNPLLTNKEFVNTKCPKCKGKATRETDTMDTFVNSSWYQLRFCDPKNNKEIFSKEKVNYWCPVDTYVGGAEHACMHLIYFRFYTKFLRDLGLLNFDEPAKKLFHQGMLHASDGRKMSKSLGNVINPLDIISEYGADSLRLALMSFASPDKDTNWEEKILLGSHKFLNKVYDYFENIKIGKADKKTESKLNKTIKEVTNQIENFKYNLAIIKIRELFNSLPHETSKEILEKSLKLLHPFCPHITEELWEKIKSKGFIVKSDWPKLEEQKIDASIDKQEEMIEKLTQDINHLTKLFSDKSKSFVYVLPNEIEMYKENINTIKKKIPIEIEIFATNNKDKHDPENKSKKAKPGKPAIYLE
jgi:leucyl-tRNA synthetase